MLVGYVSNEQYMALENVGFEFRGNGLVILAKSSISGAVFADLEAGDYEVVLGKEGYGSKIMDQGSRILDLGP